MGKASEIARRKVVGLATDERLLELLARACWAEAGRRWEMLGGRTRTKFG